MNVSPAEDTATDQVPPGQAKPCPLISVVMVVRNGAATFERALQTVISQDRSLVECIVIDGASTDGTVEILRRYNDRIDFWSSEPDAGIYDAMNKGAARARGRYVYFLGCDDLLLLNLRELERHLVDSLTIYYGNVVRQHSRRVYDGQFNAWKLSRRNICHQAIFYPAHLVARWQFTTDYKLLADWEFNLRCFGDKSLRFQYIPLTVASFTGGGASFKQRDPAFERDRTQLYRRYLPTYIYLAHLVRKTGRRQLRTLRQLMRRLNGQVTAATPSAGYDQPLRAPSPNLPGAPPSASNLAMVPPPGK